MLLDIARNGAASDDTMAFLGSLPFLVVLEVIGRNQGRQEHSPETVAALLANPATPTAVVELWQEHVERRAAAALSGSGGRRGGAPRRSHAPFEPVLVEEEEKDEERRGAARRRRGEATGCSAPSSSRSTRCSRR